MQSEIVPKPKEEIVQELSPTELRKRRRERQKQAAKDRIKQVEDELFEESLKVVRDAVRFRDIDPALDSPPEDWIEDLGEEEAWKQFRVARSGWMTKSQSPAGLEIARATAMGIIKARATEKATPKSLNLTLVSMTAPKVYRELEVDSDS